MKTLRFSTKLLAVLAGAALILTTLATTANAGRGGSHSRILNAVNSGSADAIIAEIERAELLICSRACIETVMSLLDDPRYDVREAAAWWFTRRPAHMKELNDRAAADLISDDSTAVRNAADMLGAFRHPRAVPALSAAAARTDVSAEARAAAVRALGLIGQKDGNTALASAMRDGDADVRLRAVESWRTIRGQSEAGAVVDRLGDDNVQVRRAAAAVIGSLRDGAARSALETALANDDDALVRRNAAYALGRIGDLGSRSALEAATSDKSSLVRMTAKAALRKLR